MATACILAGFTGVAVSFLAGFFGLMLLPRQGEEAAAGGEKSGLSEYVPWLWGTGAFAVCVVALIPFIELPAQPAHTVGFVIFSPVFGTVAYLIEAETSKRLSPHRPQD